MREVPRRAARESSGNGLLREAKSLRYAQRFFEAAALYRRWCEPQAGLPIIPLPSTSPANAAWSVERLARAWAALPQSVAQNPSA